jgi:hypothetical protein
MAYYKLEATHPIIAIDNRKQTYRSKRTYKWFYNSYDAMSTSLKTELDLKGKVTVKEISESEYTKGEK